MTVINGKSLLEASPITDMVDVKLNYFGTSYGLSEAGYDLRLAETITWTPPNTMAFAFLTRALNLENSDDPQNIDALKKAHLGCVTVTDAEGNKTETYGNFTLASAVDGFDMPSGLVGLVKDKSTHARRGISAFNTVIEPGWRGVLTLEVVFHDQKPVTLHAGQGIAQVLFNELSESGNYAGKYQGQKSGPTPAILDGGAV